LGVFYFKVFYFGNKAQNGFKIIYNLINNNQMENYILKENVLSDNTLLLASTGKVFKGGYIAIIKEYTYLNPWCDKEAVKRFTKLETLETYLNKYYPEIEINY
jgi:hypothetical protein